MGNSESVWKEIKRKTNAKGGNPASPRNPKKSVRQAASDLIQKLLSSACMYFECPPAKSSD